MSSTARAVTSIVVIGLVLIIAGGLIALTAGLSNRGAEKCANGATLAIESKTSGSGDEKTLTRTLRVGDCAYLSDEAFKSALAALATYPGTCSPPTTKLLAKDASGEKSTGSETEATTPTTTKPAGGDEALGKGETPASKNESTPQGAPPTTCVLAVP